MGTDASHQYFPVKRKLKLRTLDSFSQLVDLYMSVQKFMNPCINLKMSH